jgi:ketosteroid isomerase-like protein
MAATGTQTEETLEVIERFNEAFNAHDVDGIMALMTDDVVFENTGPAPDGKRYEGQDAVRRVWERVFEARPNTYFEGEDIFACDDRCVVPWKYVFDTENPEAGHVRGIDVFRVRDGKVSEKLSYVKG